VARVLAYFLTLLILLQTFSQELLVVDYQVNKARITRLYCVNKARPKLHCDGKCYLAQQLRKAENAEKKAPVGMAKVKYEVLPMQAVCLPMPARHWPPVARRFPCIPAALYAFVPADGLLHPPAFVG
jgi:hypothetical protein